MARLNQSTFSSEGNFIIHEIEVVFENDDEKPYEPDFGLRDAYHAVAIVESSGDPKVRVSQNDSDQTPVRIDKGEINRSLFHLSPDAGNILKDLQ